jgi:DHA1 family tetracycline resistance protein-like MFS transporter
VFYNFTNKNAAVHFPGAPFVLGGILMLFSAIIAFYSFKKQRLIAIANTNTDLDNQL